MLECLKKLGVQGIVDITEALDQPQLTELITEANKKAFASIIRFCKSNKIFEFTDGDEIQQLIVHL